MKTRILLILLLVSSFGFAQNWSQVGAAQFTNFTTDAAISFHPTTGEPYVIYKDLIDGNKPYVKKFDGTNWVTVGSGSIINFEAKMINLAFNPANDELNVVFKNSNTGKVDIYKFDGTNWVSITTSLTNSEYFIDTTRLQIYYDSNNAINILGNWLQTAGNQRMSRFYIDTQSNWVNQNSSFVLENNAYATSINEYVDINSSIVSKYDLVGNGVYGNSSYLSYGLQESTSIVGGDYWAATGTNTGFEKVVVSYRNFTNFPQPSNTETNLDYILDLEQDNAQNTLYLMYADNSDMLQVQSYNASNGINNGVWNTISAANVNAGTSNFFSQILFNSIDNNLYLIYLDGGKISVKKYNVPVPSNLNKIYVDVNATGNNDGSTWANAHTDLQEALFNVGNATTDLWIASGIYKPGTNRGDSFNFYDDNLNVYGGFDGTETSIFERNISANPTILSGDINGDDTGVGFTTASRLDNSYHVVSVSGNGIVLDGFKINNGHANGSTTNGSGAGLLVAENVNSLTLKNCEFNNNMGLTGGAIRASFNINTALTIENCVFDNNLSRYGSGLYLLVGNNRTATVDITNSLFTNSRSANNGSSLGFTGSAAWIRASGSNSNLTTTITNCTFANNTDIGTQSGSERGALSLARRTDGSSTHNATINNSIFYNNEGAGNVTTLAVNKGHVLLPNLTFVNNAIDEDNFSNLTFLTNTSNANPMFTDASNNDFILMVGSPAIDSGDNSKIPAGINTDLLGNDRIFNTTVDMGVYEYGSTLDVDDFELETEFTIYPNPTSNILNIKMNQGFKSAEIYNLQGRKVLESANKNINVSKLSSGLYLLKVKNDLGGVLTKRFAKE